MPGSGGNVRSHYFARTAAELGDLTIVSLCNATGQTFDPNIKNLCRHIIGGEPFDTSFMSNHTKRGNALSTLAIPWKNNWFKFVANCLQHCNATTTQRGWKQILFRKLLELEQRVLYRIGTVPPMSCMTWLCEYRKLLAEKLSKILDEDYDILWVEDVFSWPFGKDILGKLKNKPQLILCNTYNIESNVAQRNAAHASIIEAKQIALRDAYQLQLLEQKAYSASDLTIVCSEEDRIAGSRLAPRGRFSVIGNGVNISYFSRRDDRKSNAELNKILFTGTFSYLPNQQAARYFAGEVLPLIRVQIPEAIFMIAGSQAASIHSQLKLAGIDIEFVSDPTDIRPYFESASLFVVPLHSGGGTRLKILEAMAMSVPVVSTSIGAEGLGATDREHLRIANSAKEMADICIELLRNPEEQERLSRNALTWVHSNYSWELLCQKTKCLVESHFGS